MRMAGIGVPAQAQKREEVMQSSGSKPKRGQLGKSSRSSANTDGIATARNERGASNEQAGIVPYPTPRENLPPEDQLDADDRSLWRATMSDAGLQRHLEVQNNHNRLEWHRMLRHLVFCGGATALSAVVYFLAVHAGLPSEDAARFAIIGLTSTTGGYGLNNLVTTRRRRGSSRHR